MNAKKVEQELFAKFNKARAAHSMRFFKTGKGQYGYGDVFWGLSVPEQRKIAQKYRDLSFAQIKKLLGSKIHEVRLVALLILVSQFERHKDKQGDIYDFYMNHLRHINNWDLVDLSAYKIAGEYLLNKNKNILYKLAKSRILWERRVAIVSTYAFIKNGDYKHTLEISEVLLNDKEDLMHKAVGWMLREVGKRDEKVLCDFLDKNAAIMPRTALRYSIERFAEPKRQAYLKHKGKN